MAVAYLCSDTLTGIRTPLCWTSLFAGLDAPGIARLRHLENDNARLRRALEEVGTLVAALSADVEEPWQASFTWQPRAVNM